MSGTLTRGKLSWPNTLFLVGTHAVALFGTIAYAILHGFTLPTIAITLGYLLVCGMSVTGGYHRLFAHATYEAHPILRAFYLFFGAAAFENSALKWASDHRRHHAYVDKKDDPYNIKKGFWWAHMGWIFFKDPSTPPGGKVGDLERDPLVRLQHKFYIPLAIFASFVLPLGLGFLFGDPWGGLLVAGFLRLVLQHHSTFCINSLAHMLGRQPYSDSDSARDSSITALISFGEGYHNYHHTFPTDYRNGVRQWHFDPTKWFIYSLSFVGLTRGLLRIPEPVILKARVRMQARRVEARLRAHPHLAAKLAAAREQVEKMLDLWNGLKAEWAEEREKLKGRSEEMIQQLSRDVAQVRERSREAYRLWIEAVRHPHLLASARD